MAQNTMPIRSLIPLGNNYLVRPGIASSIRGSGDKAANKQNFGPCGAHSQVGG